MGLLRTNDDQNNDRKGRQDVSAVESPRRKRNNSRLEGRIKVNVGKNTGKPRLLLADDHAIVVDGLRRLLEPDFDLVGTVGDGWALLESAERLKPDVIVVDVSMPLLNGIEAVRRLKKVSPRCKVVILSCMKM